MRIFLFRFITSFFWPFAFACQSSDSFDQSNIPQISILEAHIRPFDQVVSEVRFISLRPPDNTPLNFACNNSELIITDKIYYCTKCYQRSAVHVFDLEGKYITGMIKQGDGPEEYRSIQGIHLANDVLSISSGNGEIKQYTLPDFKFINQFSVGKAFYLSSFHPLKENSWLISLEYTGELDEDGQYPVFTKVDIQNESSTPLPIKAFQATSEIGEGEIVPFKDQYLLNFGFSDTLFVYDGEQLSPHYLFDFGSKHPSLKDLTANDEEFGEIIQSQSIAINLGSIIYLEEILRLKTFGLKKNPELDLDDMRTFSFHDIYIGPEKQVVAFSSLTGLDTKGTAKDGYFYEVLQAEDWMFALEKNLLGNYGEELEAFLETIPDPEDPIIIRYKVRF